MKMFNPKKFSSFFGLDDTVEEYEYAPETPHQQESVQESRGISSLFQRSSENREFENETPVSSPSSEQLANNKVVEMNAFQSVPEANRQSKADVSQALTRKITVIEPKTYTEGKAIAKALFRKEIVIINFSAIDEQQARRIVDFTTGTVYALDGDIQRIGDEIFLCTPASIEIDSSVAKSLISTQFSDY